MTEINSEHLATRIVQFRDERRALQEMVVACFPIGSQVRLKQTHEIGTVRATANGCPDLLFIDVKDADWRPLVSVTDLERIA